jgi:hypothetical protein
VSCFTPLFPENESVILLNVFGINVKSVLKLIDRSRICSDRYPSGNSGVKHDTRYYVYHYRKCLPDNSFCFMEVSGHIVAHLVNEQC